MRVQFLTEYHYRKVTKIGTEWKRCQPGQIHSVDNAFGAEMIRRRFAKPVGDAERKIPDAVYWSGVPTTVDDGPVYEG